VGGWEQLVEQEQNKQLPLATSEQISNAADARIPVAACSRQEGKNSRHSPGGAVTVQPRHSAARHGPRTHVGSGHYLPRKENARAQQLSSANPSPSRAGPHGRRTHSPSCGGSARAIAARPSQVARDSQPRPPLRDGAPRGAPSRGTPPAPRARTARIGAVVHADLQIPLARPASQSQRWCPIDDPSWLLRSFFPLLSLPAARAQAQ